MSNGSEACCALGICCPDAPAQRVALVKIFCDDGMDESRAGLAADSIISRFSLAPKSFAAVIADIVAMQKAHGHD